MSNRRSFLATLSLGPVALASGQNTSNTASTPAAAPTASKSSVLDIFEAAYKGDTARAMELAALNPAIAHLRSTDGRTPLHYTVAGGHADMIFFFTTRGADLSAGPESPLLTAVDYSDHAAAFDMSTALLINGSNPNAKRADGRTALELAAARGYTDVVELLVHRGATGPLAEGVKVEPLHFGRRYSFDVEGKPYTPENIDGLPQDFINEFTRLSHADVERVKHLLKLAPALAFARATWDESGIEAASHMGLAPLARHLADHGAAVSVCTATVLGLRDRVEAMVKSDPDSVHERGAHDIALLAYTAFSDQRPEIADFLLRAGANVQAKALGGQTMMHLAAVKGYVELADVFLAHGADVNASVKARGQDVTPLAAAMKAKQDKMTEFLKSKGGRA